MTNVVNFPQTQLDYGLRSATLCLFGYSQEYLLNQLKVLQRSLGMTVQAEEVETDYDVEIQVQLTFQKPLSRAWLEKNLNTVCELVEHLGYRIDDSDEELFYTGDMVETGGVYFPYL